MLDLKYIKNNLELVKNGMEKRRAKIDFTSLLKYDDKRKAVVLEIEELRHKRNVVSDEVRDVQHLNKMNQCNGRSNPTHRKAKHC